MEDQPLPQLYDVSHALISNSNISRGSLLPDAPPVTIAVLPFTLSLLTALVQSMGPEFLYADILLIAKRMVSSFDLLMLCVQYIQVSYPQMTVSFV